jgi:2-iminobutanoate/2-iminopropanoate deaminase
MKIKHISTPNAPLPVGHYSQAVVHNGLVYVSGRVAPDPATGDAQTASIEAQTEQVLKNIQAVLRAAGSDLDKVLKMTVYITDISLWDGFNKVYARVMGEHRPARAAVPIKELGGGLHIEIETIAATSVEEER